MKVSYKEKSVIMFSDESYLFGFSAPLNRMVIHILFMNKPAKSADFNCSDPRNDSLISDCC